MLRIITEMVPVLARVLYVICSDVNKMKYPLWRFIVKNVISNSFFALIFVMTAVSPALAAAPAEKGGSLLLTLFIGFFALIVVFQLVPACLLFVGILKGLFSKKHDVEQKSSNR